MKYDIRNREVEEAQNISEGFEGYLRRDVSSGRAKKT